MESWELRFGECISTAIVHRHVHSEILIAVNSNFSS